MRKPSASQIALVVGSVIATGVALSQNSSELQTINVTAFVPNVYVVPSNISWWGPLQPPSGVGPGGSGSAAPSVHSSCGARFLASSITPGTHWGPPDPDNKSIAIPMRANNPIDITASSPLAAAYGSIGSTEGFAVFPALSQGTSAAIASVNGYANAASPSVPGSTYTVYDLVNTWAPVSVNPNTLGNFLSTLGMSQETAQATKLSDLSTGEMLDVIAAFAWQEGFKPAGC